METPQHVDVEHKAWPNIFECRVYLHGWALRMHRFLIRRHKDINYSSVSFEWIGSSYRLVGGESLKKYRAQQKAMRLSQ